MGELADNGLNRKLADSSQVAKEIEEVEAAIAALNVAYEQFFLGAERHPPLKEHEALKRRVQRVKGAVVRQTAIRFRIQTLQSKFLTYERLWARTMQEIENGTYRRDVFKVRKRQQAASPPAQPTQASPQTQAAGAQRPPQGAPRSPGTSPATAATGPSSSLSDASLRTVYDAFVQAKARCKEDVSRLSFETMATNLRKQVPELLKKHNAKDVDFKVVIKDGKAVLRAIPK